MVRFKIRNLVKKKHTLWAKAKKRNKIADWAKFKATRNHLSKLIKARYTAFIDKLSNDCTRNPKRFWSFFRSKTKSKYLPGAIAYMKMEAVDPKQKPQCLITFLNQFFF